MLSQVASKLCLFYICLTFSHQHVKNAYCGFCNCIITFMCIRNFFSYIVYYNYGNVVIDWFEVMALPYLRLFLTFSSATWKDIWLLCVIIFMKLCLIRKLYSCINIVVNGHQYLWSSAFTFVFLFLTSKYFSCAFSKCNQKRDIWSYQLCLYGFELMDLFIYLSGFWI